MIKYSNGEYVEMTDEEVKQIKEMDKLIQDVLPTAEQRLEALETAMLEMIMRGDTND